jgi:hypothetical protein
MQDPQSTKFRLIQYLSLAKELDDKYVSGDECNRDHKLNRIVELAKLIQKDDLEEVKKTFNF